jgi:hypothetical protein
MFAVRFVLAHDKEVLCRAAEIKRTTKNFALGKDVFNVVISTLNLIIYLAQGHTPIYHMIK